MRKQEEAAEASVREVARMASQLEAQARPIQQYEAAGSSARLAEVSQRLGRTRESLARQQGELQVLPAGVAAEGDVQWGQVPGWGLLGCGSAA